MPKLPRSALDTLEEISSSFSEKPISGTITRKLNPIHVRRSMAQARREAGSDQVPVVLYDPGAGDPLLLIHPDDLAKLLDRVARTCGSATPKKTMCNHN